MTRRGASGSNSVGSIRGAEPPWGLREPALATLRPPSPEQLFDGLAPRQVFLTALRAAAPLPGTDAAGASDATAGLVSAGWVGRYGMGAFDDPIRAAEFRPMAVLALWWRSVPPETAEHLRQVSLASADALQDALDARPERDPRELAVWRLRLEGARVFVTEAMTTGHPTALDERLGAIDRAGRSVAGWRSQAPGAEDELFELEAAIADAEDQPRPWWT